MDTAITTAERTEAVAHLKFARVGPRKMRRVANAIRGKSVKEALILLRFSGVFASEPIEKLLRSAVANAENNHSMATDDLHIRKITVDAGPGGGITKRLDPRAQGRAAFKRKRLSHVTIVVGAALVKQPKRRSGASIEMSSIASRRRSVIQPSPSRKKAAESAGSAQ
jgi:large subunit ribosomal protein L22